MDPTASPRLAAVSRRELLRAGAAGALGAAAIGFAQDSGRDEAEISMESLEQAAQRPILDRELFRDPVVVESIELLKGDGDYFVRARAKGGAEGIAVCNSRAEYLHPIFNRLVAPYFVGRDARDLEEHLFGVYREGSNYKLQGLALWCPLAWVEFALLDLLGRVAEKPIYGLLGGAVRRRIPVYVASSRRDTTPRQEVAHLEKLIEQSGARAVKYRVGGRMSRNEDASPGRTENLIPLSRKVLGDGIAIHADSNSSYDPPSAIRVGRMLEEIGAIYFEEPCPFDHLEETRQVTRALTIPVAGGEQEFSEWRFRWSIANRVVDIVQPDLQYYGGLIRSARVAAMAELAEMPTTVHISGGFGFVYMLHFAARTSKIGAYQEFKLGMEKYGGWFDPPLAAAEGSLTVPAGPGVGIKDPAALLKGAKLVA